MKETLLVSTDFHLVLWDGRQRNVGKGYFWGITWGPKELYMVHNQHIQAFDTQFREKRTVLGPLFDPHSIFWKDGVLYVTHTGANRVELWSETRDVQPFINWTEHDGVDIDHINTVWFHDGCFYAVEHRLARQPKRIRLFDRDWNQVDVYEADIECEGMGYRAEGIHNVYNDGSRLISLAANLIVTWDLQTKQHEFFSPFSGIGLAETMCYMRGMAVGDGCYYIGVTELRGHRNHRRNDSAILKLDKDFQFMGIYPLNRVGAIKEVRLLNPLDKAHNGLPYPGGLA
jgi:hypothetical protein